MIHFLSITLKMTTIFAFSDVYKSIVEGYAQYINWFVYFLNGYHGFSLLELLHVNEIYIDTRKVWLKFKTF